MSESEKYPVFVGGSYIDTDKIYPFIEIVKNKYHKNTCVEMAEEVASTYGETDEKAIACKVALKRRDQNILMAPPLDLSGLYGS